MSALVRVARNPPAGIHIVGHEVGRQQRRAGAHGVEVEAANVGAVARGVVHDVGEAVVVPELALVPGQIQEVELLGQLLLGPRAAPRPADDLAAGVDSRQVFSDVFPFQGCGHQGLVLKPGGWLEPSWDLKALDEVTVVHGCWLAFPIGHVPMLATGVF
ncbi:hypothetical protein PG993_007416 [Apiospora rasikravindrae]|uniref:Uncharacterized protein n=1 Tax=Apiospora rasikravindrae TaxID=990691 RepID=A0ABR1SZ90_9PEZI